MMSIVRLGLKTIVDWAAFGYAVAGKAANNRVPAFF
jgi:YesN/AraC family two-component response regulator